MSRLRRGWGCLVIYGYVASFKAEKRKVNVGDAWFRVSPLSLSVCLSVCLSLNWNSRLQTVLCLLLICPAIEKFVFYIVFSILIGSDWVFFAFYREGHGLAEKLLLVIFIFWQISSTFRYAPILCAETPFFILKKVSAPITSGECSCGFKLQSLFCMYDELERDLFRLYNNHKVPKSVNFNSSYIRHVHSPAPWNKWRYSTFQSRIITSRALIASSHSQWLLRSRKNEFNFSKVKFEVLKSVNLRQSLGHVRSLFCREAKRGIQLFKVEL